MMYWAEFILAEFHGRISLILVDLGRLGTRLCLIKTRYMRNINDLAVGPII